ncbi:twin-arginine translocation pathway signal protein [Ramlibacter henchirensis]|uniref:Twin-arginine translocation pathway signal protein n=1 Tax=Ramlibacter henchirensis TaxID=204072 RepID=A0A4Z0C8G1_9BURK|nr:twin-arginine translocation pathway signal protein [Ramlibacter henchirensis]
MKRRTLMQLAAAGAVPGLPGCLWSENGNAHPPRPGFTIGTNLSGMEWPQPGVRKTLSTAPNLHYTPPRRADIAWLADRGFRKNRLPILWEMLQPVLHDAKPNAQARALVGAPGEFHARYAQCITEVLDAHAAVGAKVILDLHNYCRYRDFRYAADGSVPGLKPGPTPLHRPFTHDPGGVQERIFSLAPGATLTQAHFTDFWTRAARRWKDHPGLAGYGLMNEPHDMPRSGQVQESQGGGEDLAIWPAYARAAVEAIRKIDARTPIYVAGNAWSSAMAMASRNPGFPLPGENLVYEVHLYLDAASNGFAFDFDTEVGKGFSAGLGRRAIDLDTGVKRLAMAANWAREKNLKLALTEIGMPLDDPRWQEMFQRTLTFAVREGVEVYSWMHGNHWPIRNYPIHHVPGWHQHRTLEPAVAGPMLQAAGLAKATLYDDGGGWAPAGREVTITVYARGWLEQPLTLQVASRGGRLNKTTLTIPAGANGMDSYTFKTEAEGVATITYAAAGDVQLPPPRKVYSFADPPAVAGQQLADAAHALLAKYGAPKWEMAHGHTDYVRGAPAQDGQPLRAVADTGFGSSPGNAMEMLCFLNSDGAAAGPMKPPVLRVVEGRKAMDLSAPDTWGLWCKKRAPQPGVQAKPRDRVPYDLQDDHFALVAIAATNPNATGVVFQASRAEQRQFSELALEQGRPQARWSDGRGQPLVVTSPDPLPPRMPLVLTLTSGAGAQVLRVNGRPVGQAGATLPQAFFDQLLIGWGFVDHYPRDSFRGLVFGAIAGKGRPSEAELAVLERYLLSLAVDRERP